MPFSRSPSFTQLATVGYAADVAWSSRYVRRPRSAGSFWAAALAAPLSLALGSGAFAADCPQSAQRLAEGDWSGTYQKEITLRGGSFNSTANYKFYGSIRLHVKADGSVEALQGDLTMSISHRTNGHDGSQNSQSKSSTSLSLIDDQNSSQHFRAAASAKLEIHDTMSGSSGKGTFDYSITGRTLLDFRLSETTCDRASGTLDSPLFGNIRDMASSKNLAVTSDPAGTWVVTNSSSPAKPEQIRARITH